MSLMTWTGKTLWNKMDINTNLKKKRSSDIFFVMKSPFSSSHRDRGLMKKWWSHHVTYFWAYLDANSILINVPVCSIHFISICFFLLLFFDRFVSQKTLWGSNIQLWLLLLWTNLILFYSIIYIRVRLQIDEFSPWQQKKKKR